MLQMWFFNAQGRGSFTSAAKPWQKASQPVLFGSDIKEMNALAAGGQLKRRARTARCNKLAPYSATGAAEQLSIHITSSDHNNKYNPHVDVSR